MKLLIEYGPLQLTPNLPTRLSPHLAPIVIDHYQSVIDKCLYHASTNPPQAGVPLHLLKKKSDCDGTTVLVEWGTRLLCLFGALQ